MDDMANKNWGVNTLSESEAKRELLVAVWGAALCYGLMLWLL